jgi:3-mercaptopyruvate sulfurtransferase SseA
VRALLGGWNAWLAAKGDTETESQAGGMTTHSHASGQEHRIASPNPTIRENNATTSGDATTTVAPVRPASATKAAPMKTTKSKPKSKRRRTR